MCSMSIPKRGRSQVSNRTGIELSYEESQAYKTALEHLYRRRDNLNRAIAALEALIPWIRTPEMAQTIAIGSSLHANPLIANPLAPEVNVAVPDYSKAF